MPGLAPQQPELRVALGIGEVLEAGVGVLVVLRIALADPTRLVPVLRVVGQLLLLLLAPSGVEPARLPLRHLPADVISVVITQLLVIYLLVVIFVLVVFLVGSLRLSVDELRARLRWFLAARLLGWPLLGRLAALPLRLVLILIGLLVLALVLVLRLAPSRRER